MARWVVVVTLVLVGCVPVVFHTYLEPAIQGESRLHRGRTCHGGVGPFDVMSFVRDDVTIHINAARSNDHVGLRIFMWFEVPDGKIVELPEKFIQLAIADSTEFLQVNFIVEESLSGPLIGTTHKRRLTIDEEGIFQNYHVDLLVQIPEAKAYRLVLPKILINGQAISVSEITLMEKTRPEFFYPLNC